jgi:hypothetical protein
MVRTYCEPINPAPPVTRILTPPPPTSALTRTYELIWTLL